MINTRYLDTLPEAANTYNVPLGQGERVVFTSELSTFGDEKQKVLGGWGSKFTLTNERIIADNGLGIWSIDLLEDVISITRVDYRFLFSNSTYFLVTLNKDVVCDNGKRTLGGYSFYFGKEVTPRFDEIVKCLKG